MIMLMYLVGRVGPVADVHGSGRCLGCCVVGRAHIRYSASLASYRIVLQIILRSLLLRTQALPGC